MYYDCHRIEIQHRMMKDRTEITVDDIRNYLKKERGTETVYMQRRTVLLPVWLITNKK